MSKEWINANIKKMLNSTDTEVAKTAQLILSNNSKVRTKANVLDKYGVNRWSKIDLPAKKLGGQ